MKKILAIAVVASALVGCNNHQAEVTDLQQKVDTLQKIIDQKDKNFALIAGTMSELQQNLNVIKEKEGLISTNLNESNKSQLQDDVDAIYKVLLDNKQKVKSLEAQLRKATSNNKELQQLISVLQEQIDQQNKEIEKLTTMLKDKDLDINALTGAVISLTSSVDSLATEKAKVDKSLAIATNEINTVFYIVGTKSYLRDKGVVEKDGLFKKKILAGDVDNRIFNAVNKNEVTKIDLGGRRAKVLSQHNESSYEIVDNDDRTQSLVIKNAEAFWQTSKYLVVQIKD
ncbi:MAG: hypothetical protein IKR17_03730 [Bacteroidales bacterium]|nr:hypothetical protein [Bacteroidales bacterium]